MWFSHSKSEAINIKSLSYPTSSQNKIACFEGPMTLFEREVSASLNAEFIFLLGLYSLHLFIYRMAKRFVGSSQNKIACFEGPMALFEREVSAVLSQLDIQLNLM